MITILIYLLLIVRTMSNPYKKIAHELYHSDSLEHRRQVMRDLFDSTINNHAQAHKLEPHHPRMISDIMQGMLHIHPTQVSDNN